LHRSLVIIILAIAVLLWGSFSAARAQAPTDVPRDHWAYEAVEQLAARGLVKGYPPDGRFFGQRTVTRYEMASVVLRVIRQIDDIYQKKADRPDAPPPTADALTRERLEQLRRLTDEFRTELNIIGADLKTLRGQMAALSNRVDETRRAAERASQDAGAARRAADDAKAVSESTRNEVKELRNTLTLTKGEVDRLTKEQRAHRIGGYIQARFEGLEGGGSSLFNPAGSGGTGQTPTTGGPAVGGPRYGFSVRRARLRLSGPVSPRTDYQLQIDAGSVGAVSVLDAYINVAGLPAKGVTGRFGLFTPMFGHELQHSSATRESPERAMGFGTGAADYPIFKTAVSGTGGTVTPGSVLPLFLGQNRDVGAAFLWSTPGDAKTATRASLAVINGEGRAATGARNQNQSLDWLGRVEKGFAGGNLTVGLSGYYGSFSVRSGPPVAGTPAPFRQAYRAFGGADARWLSPWGTSLRAEFLAGEFEATPDRAQYLQNNTVKSWLFVARHPLSKRMELVAKYDEYYPIARSDKSAGGLGRMELARKTLSIGILTMLDDATRLRLWYMKGLTPYDPSAATGPLRARLGLLTGEVQVLF
jgi:hypothetical protein